MIDTTHLIIYDTLKTTIYTLQPAENNTDLIIVLSSLITILILAFITFFSNSLINKQRYQNEYYRQVLEKRIKAYSLAEKLNITAQKLELYPPELLVYYHKIFSNIETYDRFYNLLNEVINNSFWLNPKTFLLIKSLDYHLDKTINPAYMEKNEEKLRYEGWQSSKEIFSFAVMLTDRLREDWIDLHNVNQFFIDSKKDNKENKPTLQTETLTREEVQAEPYRKNPKTDKT